MTLIPPGKPFTLGQEFELRPNDMARLGEEFFITNGGTVRRMTREKKEETIIRLTVRLKRASGPQLSDSLSTHQGESQNWGGFRITVTSVKPNNDLRLLVAR
jgi:hypothetical protein